MEGFSCGGGRGGRPVGMGRVDMGVCGILVVIEGVFSAVGAVIIDGDKFSNTAW